MTTKKVAKAVANKIAKNKTTPRELYPTYVVGDVVCLKGSKEAHAVENFFFYNSDGYYYYMLQGVEKYYTAPELIKCNNSICVIYTTSDNTTPPPVLTPFKPSKTIIKDIRNFFDKQRSLTEMFTNAFNYWSVIIDFENTEIMPLEFKINNNNLLVDIINSSLLEFTAHSTDVNFTLKIRVKEVMPSV